MKKKGYQMSKHGVTVDDHDIPSQKAPYPSQSAIQKAGHEVKENEPAIVGHTRKKYGKKRARAQKVAIMLSKARKGK